MLSEEFLVSKASKHLLFVTRGIMLHAIAGTATARMIPVLG